MIVTLRNEPVPRERKSDAECCPEPDERPDLRPVEGDEADEELAAHARWATSPASRSCGSSARGTCICGDVVSELPLAQSTVSQHLEALEEVGLIRGDIDGPRVCYCIEPRALRRLEVLVAGL
jgi:DNA-binding transcriptional ArsR family regulator